MAALLLNTLIGNAVLPLDSSTTCKAHREVCVWRHTLVHRLTKRRHTRAQALSRAEHVGARTRPHAFRFRAGVAPHRVLATCERTWMTCMVAAQPCGGNEAINQSINQERTASARCFSPSVCRFFQRREVAVVEWWLHDSHLLPPV